MFGSNRTGGIASTDCRSGASAAIDEDCKIWSGGNEQGFALSISMGYVSYPSKKMGYKITPLLSEADSLMYIEKREKKAKKKEKEKV